MKVLVIAAHPDDELLGVGATVARHVKDGDSAAVLIVSEGASSRYAEGQDSVLRRSAEEAGKVLGIGSIEFLGLPDQKLDAMPILEVVQPVEEAVAHHRPDVVYTHHWGDLNRDHRVVSEAVLVACRPVSPHAPRQLLYFETPSSTEWGLADPGATFAPTLFVDVTATIDAKLEAMACYQTELRPEPHPRSLSALRARAAYWGQFAHTAYAEPFVVARVIR